MRRIVLAAVLLAPAAASAQAFQPGSWASTTTIRSMSMPGVPAEAMKGALGKPFAATVCITAQDVADGPKKLMQASKGQCRYADYRMSGGVIAGTATCADPHQGTMTTRLRGTYTPAAYAIDMDSSSSSGMKMTMTSSGRRVGACKK